MLANPKHQTGLANVQPKANRQPLVKTFSTRTANCLFSINKKLGTIFAG